VCCSVLQCVAVCCSVLQCVTRYLSRWNLNRALHSTSSAVCCSVSVLQGVAVSVRCSVLQCVAAVCCSVLQCARYPTKCNLNRALHSTSSADVGKHKIRNSQLATKFDICKLAIYNISIELTFENSHSISYASDPSRRN